MKTDPLNMTIQEWKAEAQLTEQQDILPLVSNWPNVELVPNLAISL